MADFPVKLSPVREEQAELKRWLREVMPDDLSQQAIADELGVTRKTISNLLSPNAGFGNGLTMIRYLRLAGVVADVPSGGSRLATLEEMVYRTGSATASALEDLSARLQSVERALKLPDARAKAG